MQSFWYSQSSFSKSMGIFLRIYLATFLGCVAPRPPSPPTSVARAMETRSYTNSKDKVMKASINVLQDLSYTVDVINVEMGLLTASRSTQGQEARLSKDEELIESVSTWKKALLAATGIFVAIGIFGLLFGGKDGDQNESDNKTHVIHHGSSHDDGTEGPIIYRYRITVNLDKIKKEEIKVRVSAQGEIEQDGNILQTGGIHEVEFFQQFFANLEKSLFLEK
tara:strand:+ start:1634 stop:2299 length:666 start_codon:yes stop_codon:yes gene_type:complete